MPVRFITDKDSTLHYEKQLLTDEEKAQARENIDVDVSGTAIKAIAAHSIDATAHDDIRTLITGLSTRLNAIADSDDTTLDQISELVAYIKDNRDLIEIVTTNKADKAALDSYYNKTQTEEQINSKIANIKFPVTSVNGQTSGVEIEDIAISEIQSLFGADV